jgi:AcrR family transcriptional regulator
MRLTEVTPAADHRRQTKERILDVAERMFAEQGFELTSLRALTAQADVNVAAVHYHFGSKERLFEAVLQRLVRPVNDERLARLDALDAAGPPSLEALIDAFVGPPLRLGLNRSGTACLLLGRCMSSPDEQMRVLLMRLFGTVLDRFIPAFQGALPHLPGHEVLWRMFFMLGVMTQTLSAGPQLAYVSQGACAPDRAEESVPRIVQFVAAGMRAPVPGRPS